MLNQSLAQIVAKGVGHQIDHVGVHLAKDLVQMVLVPILELLLEVAAAVLVQAEGIQLTDQALKGNTREPVELYAM